MSSTIINKNQAKIAIIGIGYVGLPLAVAFAKLYNVIAFDTNTTRVSELKRGQDKTNEVGQSELLSAHRLTFTNEVADLNQCDFIIITVPTPIDQGKHPDLTPLIKASETVGKVLSEGNVVVYESTVYPGVTEDVCVPILEKNSGLKFNIDFYVGYSPERVNPGDREHRIADIKKVTSGSTPEAAELVDSIYADIISAGTYKAHSIKVAEAAKVIENIQRDVNIALVNELTLIFNRMNIDTEEVLKAAGTKWNFIPFRPGLVGGHCIGVDPYYLTYKAQELGYNPEVILAGRRLNDNMGSYIALQLIKAMTKRQIPIAQARVLIMGFAFKENCPDIRNTKVIDVVHELKEFECNVDVYDPNVCADEVMEEYGIILQQEPKKGVYDAIVVAVAHQQFVELGPIAIREFGKKANVLYDVKSLFAKQVSDLRL